MSSVAHVRVPHAKFGLIVNDDLMKIEGFSFR
jgi:hypothetical protein